MARAFDLNLEPSKLRERYGRHLWGQSCLLARRLAEAGSAVVGNQTRGNLVRERKLHPVPDGKTVAIP